MCPLEVKTELTRPIDLPGCWDFFVCGGVLSALVAVPVCTRTCLSVSPELPSFHHSKPQSSSYGQTPLTVKVLSAGPDSVFFVFRLDFYSQV